MIVWSGGVDSTLLLCRAVKESDEPVRVLSFYQKNAASCEKDKEARECILKTLRSRGHQIEQTEIWVRKEGEGRFGDASLVQPVWWLGLAIPTLKDEEPLQLGYIRGDDFWHKSESWKWAAHYLGAVAGITVNVEFPLEWMTKAEVIQELRKHRIISKVSYCEGHTKRRSCGRCIKCKKHRQAMEELRDG